MTAWFYLLIAVAIASIIGLTVIVVRASGARRKSRLEAQVVNLSAQLGEANHELKAFSYSISHDLRAPLRSVLGFSQILEEDYSDKIDDEGRKSIASLQRNAKKMNQLIDDLLRLSKVLHQSLQKNVISLDDQVSDIVAGLRETYGETVIQIQPLPTVNADRGLLDQVWSNLISNAMKFSSKTNNPQVNIGYQETKSEFIFHVKDNGAGFDMQFAGRLFGVFQRLHADREFPGTGIGLALVRRIVIRHGGRIWAEGKVNEGASFYFTLPKEE
jgi:light-regulated signal transduction histidine kinase (bacteriophytochrome)